jgi:ElaB/YqjD/DUF883 family membrane-anchored ribosome-binding protein
MKTENIINNVKDHAETMLDQINDHTEQIRKTVDSAYENAAKEMKRMKIATEEMVEDSRHIVRKDPLTYVGAGILAGAALGFVLGYFAMQPKSHK